MSDESTLSGWHRDPSGRHELRFWDGDRWTEHVLDEGIPGLDHPTRSGRPAADTTPTPTPEPPQPEAPTRVIDLDAEAHAEHTAPSTPEPARPPESDPEVETPAATTETDAPAPETGDDRDTPAVAPAADQPVPARVAGPARRVPPAPVRPIPSPAGPPAPTRRVEPAADAPPAEPVSAEAAETEAAPAAAASAAERPATEVAGEPETGAEDAPPADERRRTPRGPRELPRLAEPRLVADPPSVASPAGSSAGSTTSAIGDPHRHTARDASPRVSGVVPAPAKRYRPGSPPPSPHVGPRALPPAPTLGPPIILWYRRPVTWIAILLVVALAAGSVALVTSLGDDSGSGRLGARPPAAAPRGTQVIENNGVAIAATKGWIVASDPGNTFPLLKRTNWGETLAAVDPAGSEALVVAPLHGLEHLPQVDPDLFWSDQTGTASSIDRSDVVSFSVHGYRANRIELTGQGVVIEAAAIDTGDGTYLVAVRAPSAAQAESEFERVIQTFDLR